MEDDLAELEANLGVVNDKGDLSCSIHQFVLLNPSLGAAIPRTLNETDESTRSSTNSAQSVGHTLGVASNGRTSSAADARQTILRPRSGVAGGFAGFLGGLAGLLGGGALEAAGGQAQSRGSEHGTGEGLHFGRM